MKTVKILEKICTSLCSSGLEDGTGEVIKGLVSSFSDSVEYDALGNLLVTINPNGKKHIALFAHMDKIGLTVTSVDKETGFLRVTPCGKVDARVLSAQRVKVFGTKTLDGTLISTPPHLTPRGGGKTALPVNEQAIDCGLSADEMCKYVCAGVRAMFFAPFTELKNNCVSAPYIDNSAGCTVLIKTLEGLKDKLTDCCVTAVFTTREETGKQGAKAAAFALKPYKAFVTDVSFASAPGVPTEVSSPSGSGAMIGCSPILDNKMFSELKLTAEKNNIAYTVEVLGRSTGTDADVIVPTANGIKTALISIPLKNMHTHAETVNLEDITAASNLITAYILMEEN